MQDSTRRLLRHEALVGGISNLVFNALIAWLLLRGGPALGWGGPSSFAVDLLATAFLLPLIVALIVIPLQRRKLARGAAAPLAGRCEGAYAWVERLPRGTLAAAVVFGLLGLCLFAPLTLLGMLAVGVEQIQPGHYALFKGLWAGLLAAVLAPPMVLCALRRAAAPT